ncbi:1255_t:CDS:2 [Funneliformis caledonium]|uniref:1255_t:CDS:1 n=1 Tax=Funneliformis caledonium TaxID=1117310 RepID=A0A9N9HZ21_9GLOM|nr:1255_t:CDS:2 [Funneliformis caledonium]
MDISENITLCYEKNKDLNSKTPISELYNTNENVLEIVINDITNKMSKLAIYKDIPNFEYASLAFNHEFKDDSYYVQNFHNYIILCHNSFKDRDSTKHNPSEFWKHHLEDNDISLSIHFSSNLIASYLGTCLVISQDKIKALAYYSPKLIITEASYEFLNNNILNRIIQLLRQRIVESEKCDKLVEKLILVLIH